MGRKRKKTNYKKSLTPKQIITGLWVQDREYNGLPNISLPAEIPRNHKMTNDDIRDYVTYNGLGDSIYSEIPHYKIEDQTLAKLWNEARYAMQKVMEYLYN